VLVISQVNLFGIPAIFKSGCKHVSLLDMDIQSCFKL
jgi:hypothetical protein